MLFINYAAGAPGQLTVLHSEQDRSVQRSRNSSPAAFLAQQDKRAAEREGQSGCNLSRSHGTQILWSFQRYTYTTYTPAWELQPTPTSPFLDRRAAAVSLTRSPTVHCGDHLIWTAFANETFFLVLDGRLIALGGVSTIYYTFSYADLPLDLFCHLNNSFILKDGRAQREMLCS